MLKLQHTAQGPKAVVMCDACGRQVLDSSAGLAYLPAGGDELLDLFHVHKGTCRDTAAAQHGATSGTWQDLIGHLNDLRRHTGTSFKDLVLKEAGQQNLGLDRYNRLVAAVNEVTALLEDPAVG